MPLCYIDCSSISAYDDCQAYAGRTQSDNDASDGDVDECESDDSVTERSNRRSSSARRRESDYLYDSEGGHKFWC